MALRKELGRIKHVRVGYGGYQDAFIGVQFELGGDGWGVGTPMYGYWAPSLIKHSEHCKWSEADRTKGLADAMRKLDEFLKAAKKDDATKLVGVPVEVELDGNTLRDWRVLTEVL